MHKSLDLLFEPDTFAKGEDLYASGSVVEWNKIGKKLHTISVRDGLTYEVELLKPFQKGVRTSCDCHIYKEQKECSHIVCALLYFRDHSKVVSPKKSNNKPKKTSSITMKMLLEGVGHEELKTFLQGYASRDKKFYNAMKVNFIRKIEIEDNEKKYTTLLDSIVKPVASRSQTLKISEFKSFKKIVDDLIEQAEDAIALNEYVEANYILKAVINKLHYIDHYFSEYRLEVKDLLIDYYTLVVKILKVEEVSVELKSQIKEELRSLCDRSYFHARINLFNPYEIIFNCFPLSRETLEKLLQELKDKELSNEEIRLKYSLLFRIRKGQNEEDVFKIPKDYVSEIEGVSKYILEAGEAALALACLEYFVGLYPSDMIFIGALLELYFINEADDKIVSFAVDTFKKTKNLRIFDAIKRRGKDDLIDLVREQVKDNMPARISNSKRLELYYKLEDPDSLMQNLYALKDIRYVMQYDRFLNNHFKSELEELYLMLVDEYLGNHIGAYAHTFIHELKAHLSSNKMARISKKITDLIDKKFSHRTNLNDLG